MARRSAGRRWCSSSASICARKAIVYVLVTPVEKVGIKVEDAPFLAVEMLSKTGTNDGATLCSGPTWTIVVTAGAEHPLRFERGASGGLKPYVQVRGDLWALVKRALFYDLVELGETRSVNGEDMFGIASNGVFFPMVRADQLETLS